MYLNTHAFHDTSWRILYTLPLNSEEKTYMRGVKGGGPITINIKKWAPITINVKIYPLITITIINIVYITITLDAVTPPALG